MSNLFNEKQLRIFYEDQSFVIFLSDYFTTYNVTNIESDIDTDDRGIDKINIYARVLLANVRNLFELIDELVYGISFFHKKNIQSCKGEIRGKILINQLTKEIVSHNLPRRYECIQKKKTYCTPENVLICYSLLKILKEMDRFIISINESNKNIKDKFRNGYEYARIIECIGECEDFITSKYFAECRREAERWLNEYDSNMPDKLLEMVEKRLRDDRVANIQLYKKILEWIKKYLRRGITFVTQNLIEIMRYDDDFADSLFELWTLYRLKRSVAHKITFDSVDYYKFSRTDGVVFECRFGLNVIEFIYQKGKGVYWDDNNTTSWEYTLPSKKSLCGVPDITIRVSGVRKRIIMLDVKNKMRESSQISEEVYKMIGYFDNFSRVFESSDYNDTPKEGILFFRGDNKPFKKELKKTNSHYCIRAITVSPTSDKNLNDNQFNYIADIVFSIINEKS